MAAFSYSLNAQEDHEDEENTDLPITIFNEGQDFHEKNEFAEAIKRYKKALEIFPEFPEAELQLGNAFRSMGDVDKAEAAFRRALGLREDWSLAMSALGSILVIKAEFNEAEALLTEAIKLDQQNFPAWVALVELRLKTNANGSVKRELLAEVTSLTSKARPTASIWAARASLEQSLGDIRSSSASAERSLSIEPNNISALAILAELSLQQNDPVSAEPFIVRLEAQDPGSVNTKLLRSRLFLAKNDVENAINILESVKPATPESASLLEKIKLATTEDPAELEKQLVSGEDPVILGRLCNLYRVRDPLKALEFCQRAAAAEPDNITHAIGFGAALVQAKRYEDAASLLSKLAAEDPENRTIRTNLATAFFQARRYAQAKTEFQWLLKKQPDLLIGYYFLAISHDNLGELMDAMANYQEFLRRADPDKNKDEIDRITLRLPALDRQIKQRGRKTND